MSGNVPMSDLFQGQHFSQSPQSAHWTLRGGGIVLVISRIRKSHRQKLVCKFTIQKNPQLPSRWGSKRSQGFEAQESISVCFCSPLVLLTTTNLTFQGLCGIICYFGNIWFRSKKKKRAFVISSQIWAAPQGFRSVCLRQWVISDRLNWFHQAFLCSIPQPYHQSRSEKSQRDKSWDLSTT